MQEKSFEKRKMEYELRIEAKTPVELLTYHGHIVSESDLKMIKELKETGLNNGVLNVLLEHVLLVSHNRILHPLVIELAEYWLSQNIITVEHAVEYATKEQRKYIKWLKKKAIAEQSVVSKWHSPLTTIKLSVLRDFL
ncbi:DnaD domain protein [Metabacillus dongyingensis]|uniref:DnaD domain protein n=1 Tax=Metabacillus dongyingensis TaxID=2874282 RepID=UPI003B8AA7D8